MLLAPPVGLGDAVPGERLGEDAVEYEPLVGEAQLGELGGGAGGFAECAAVGAGDEDQRRRRGIGEHGDRGLVDRALAFQPLERADAGRLLRCRREVARPRRRQ